MGREESSRRLFLIRSLSGVSAAWLTAHLPAILAAHEHAHLAAESATPVKFEFFTPEQATEVEAVAAQIIPTDKMPGAREARTVYFIDRALTTFDRDKQALYTQGLQDLQMRTGELFPGAGRFSGLTAPRQIQLLTAIEKTEFFELVRLHTVMGFLANPEYGGNHDKIGWKLIGFEDKFFYEPPFGFYDRESKVSPVSPAQRPNRNA
jgi:gluconate 2-dehydrogenase gamma chain